MSVIAPDTVLAVQSVFPADLFKGFTVLDVSYGDFISGNLITIGDEEVISNVHNIEGNILLTKNGFKVHEVDLSEFVKGTGGPSCLILHLEMRSGLLTALHICCPRRTSTLRM